MAEPALQLRLQRVIPGAADTRVALLHIEVLRIGSKCLSQTAREVRIRLTEARSDYLRAVDWPLQKAAERQTVDWKLVEIGRRVQACSAVADVADFNQILLDLMLNVKRPVRNPGCLAEVLR